MLFNPVVNGVEEFSLVIHYRADRLLVLAVQVDERRRLGCRVAEVVVEYMVAL